MLTDYSVSPNLLGDAGLDETRMDIVDDLRANNGKQAGPSYVLNTLLLTVSLPTPQTSSAYCMPRCIAVCIAVCIPFFLH